MRNNLRSTYAVLFINSGKAKIPLSPTAERIDRGAATIPPNGMAMVAVGDDQMVMDIRYLAICFQIHPLQHGGTLHIYPEDSFVDWKLDHVKPLNTHSLTQNRPLNLTEKL